MSDVVVSVVESETNVVVSEQDVAVDVTENVVQVSVSTAGIQGVPGANNDPTYVTVRNATGATLAKGTIVYISGANGNNVQVTPAIATSDATSARTLGWLAVSIPNNGSGLCMVEGYLEGLNTQSFNAGDQLYLSGTVAGGFTATKPVAPIHLVYVGVVTKKSAGDGHVFVKVQNGYELGELHDVAITNPTNNQVLAYDSATQLWKNATNAPDGVTSITATAPLTGGTITSTGSIGLDQTALSITKSQVSDFTSGTVTSASTAQQAGTAVYAVNSGTAVYATTSGTATYSTNAGTAVYSTTSGTAVTITGDITKSQVSDFTSGTVASAGTAQQSGTAVYALTSGTATFATTSGTATFATNAGTAVFATNAGTAVGVSGSAITQSQVVNLVSDLAAKVNLAGGNAITGAQSITVPGTFGVTALNIRSSTNGASNYANMRFQSSDNSLFDMGKNEVSNQSGSFYLYTGSNLPIEIYNGNTKRLIVESTGNINVGPNTGTGFAKLTVFNDSTSKVAMAIRGVASQSADLFQAQDSAANTVFRIQSGGFFISPNGGALGGLSAGFASTAVSIGSGSTTNRALVLQGVVNQVANLNEFRDGNGGIVIGGRNANAQIFTGSTAPIQTAVGAGINGVSGNGTTVTFSTTNAHGLANGDRVTIAGLTPAGYNGTYIISGVSTFSFNIANATTGTASGSGTVSVDAQTSITNRSAGTTAAIIRGASGQASNLLEVQNNGAVNLAVISSTGTFRSAGLITAGSSTDVLGQLSVITTAASRIGAVIRGAASQTANLQEWQESNAGVPSAVSAFGQFRIRTFGASYTDTSLAVNAGYAAEVPIRVRGAASQSANLLELQNSAGVVQALVNPFGAASFGTSSVLGRVSVSTGSTGTIGQVIRGVSGQTANLQEWQSDTASIVARIDSNGNLRANIVQTLGAGADLREGSGGGGLATLIKMGSLPSAPGANAGRLYFRDGTNAGTLKLVVRAGAAGAETTILDNIPQ